MFQETEVTSDLPNDRKTRERKTRKNTELLPVLVFQALSGNGFYQLRPARDISTKKRKIKSKTRRIHRGFQSFSHTRRKVKTGILRKRRFLSTHFDVHFFGHDRRNRGGQMGKNTKEKLDFTEFPVIRDTRKDQNPRRILLVLEKVSSFLEFSLIHLPKSSKIVKQSCKFSRGGESQKLQVAFSFDENSLFCTSKASLLCRNTRAAKNHKIRRKSLKINKNTRKHVVFQQKNCVDNTSVGSRGLLEGLSGKFAKHSKTRAASTKQQIIR